MLYAARSFMHRGKRSHLNSRRSTIIVLSRSRTYVEENLLLDTCHYCALAYAHIRWDS